MNLTTTFPHVVFVQAANPIFPLMNLALIIILMLMEHFLLCHAGLKAMATAAHLAIGVMYLTSMVLR